jgi:hypothetical protein
MRIHTLREFLGIGRFAPKIRQTSCCMGDIFPNQNALISDLLQINAYAK